MVETYYNWKWTYKDEDNDVSTYGQIAAWEREDAVEKMEYLIENTLDVEFDEKCLTLIRKD